MIGLLCLNTSSSETYLAFSCAINKGYIAAISGVVLPTGTLDLHAQCAQYSTSMVQCIKYLRKKVDCSVLDDIILLFYSP